MKYKLTIGDINIPIQECNEPIQGGGGRFEYYMKRKNNLYFRSGKDKLRISLNEIPQELSELHYHDEVYAKYKY